jgi:hypothetical protein
LALVPLKRSFLSILCILPAVSALADQAPVPTQAEVRTIAETLWLGGCREAQVINRYLAIAKPRGNDMAKVMDSFIAAMPDVLTPQGETINAVDLPGHLWSLLAQASESDAIDEPLQTGLLALWDASLTYLRGGRDFMGGTTAVFIGGSRDPRGNFDQASKELVSAADKAGAILERQSCTQWLLENP